MNQSQGQNPDGQQDGDFMSEAKDWAGELISGQTGTGRILVSGAHLWTDRDRQDPGKWSSSLDRQGQAGSW
jgi:hypothetical protein